MRLEAARDPSQKACQGHERCAPNAHAYVHADGVDCFMCTCVYMCVHVCVYVCMCMCDFRCLEPCSCQESYSQPWQRKYPQQPKLIHCTIILHHMDVTDIVVHHTMPPSASFIFLLQATACVKDLGRWQPTDDFLLISAVEQVSTELHFLCT